MEFAAARRVKSSRTGAFVLALGLATLAAMVPQRDMLQHTDVEGGGELRMARKRAALRAVLDFYSEYAGAQVAGSQYDTNAIGEAWGGAAMGHWVASCVACSERVCLISILIWGTTARA